MNARQFFDLVVKMRESQREYYRTRSSTILKEAKELEQNVDREIDRVNNLLAMRGAMEAKNE